MNYQFVQLIAQFMELQDIILKLVDLHICIICAVDLLYIT